MPRITSPLGSSALVGALAGLLLCGAACGNNDTNNTPAADMGPADMGATDMGPADMGPVDMGPADMGVDMAPPAGEDVLITALSVFPPVPVSCDSPTSRFRLPFTLITDKARAAVPGDRIAGRPLVPNETVTVGSIDVRRARVSSLSDSVCETDADCTTGFRCAAGGLANALKQCTSTTGLNFLPDSVQLDVQASFGEQDRQLVTVLLDNSSSLKGFLPKEVGERYDANGERALFLDEELATDTFNNIRMLYTHREAVDQFIVNVASALDPVNSQISVWTFAGDQPLNVQPLTNPGDMEDHFTSDLSAPQALLSAIPEPANGRGTGNVYQAIMRVIDRDLGLSKYANHEKFLVIVTDGANEVWDKDATYQKVLEELNKHNIKLHIVHFDPKINEAKMRDFVTLWAGGRNCRNDESCEKAPTCSADTDCQSHETCRPATVYSESAEVPPTQTPDSYCMPRYEGGRLGPVDEYAELGCRTGGNYYYVSSVGQMLPPLRNLPFAFDGQWSIEANISQLDTSKGVSPGYYRLSGVFMGLFGNVAIGDRLTSSTPTSDGGLRLDNRLVVRAGR